MADAQNDTPDLSENQLVAELLTKGAQDARVHRGFIGASHDDAYITLYQSLDRLGDTVEILRDDVPHVIDAPRSNLGAVILWVKSSANFSVRRTETNAAPRRAPSGRAQEVTTGRLRMNLRPAWGGGVCTSVCEPCISWCDCNICQTLPPE